MGMDAIISLPGLATTAITGTLTLTKSGSTARVATFLDSSGTVAYYEAAGTWTGIQSITNATAATNTTTGALVVTGGVGIGGATYIGGNLNLVGSTPTLVMSTGSNVTASIQLSTVSVQRCRLDADSTSTRINVASTDRITFPIASNTVQVPVSMLVGTSGTVTAAPLTVSPSTWPTAIPTAGQVGFYLGVTNEATASYRTIGAGYCSGTTNLPCIFGYFQTTSAGNTTGRFIVGTRNGTGDTAPTVNLSVEPTGSIILGSSALSTSATDGFLYVATCAGTPTGAPTAATGRVAVVYDTTNNQLCVYNGAWKKVTLA